MIPFIESSCSLGDAAYQAGYKEKLGKDDGGIRMLMSNEERGRVVLREGVGHGIWLHFILSEEFHGLLHYKPCTSRGKTCENKLKERENSVHGWTIH